MHRFYVETVVGAVGESIVLSQEESTHAARVLRLAPGDRVQLLDGECLYDATLLQVAASGTTLRVEARLPSPEMETQVLLVQGLPKADKLEWIVQKATELGVWCIWPVQMARSVAKGEQGDRQQKKQQRWQRIALEAAKQSGRAHVPATWELCGFAKALERLAQLAPPLDGLFIAWEEAHALRLSEAVIRACAKQGPKKIAIVIGPEGGITQEECQALVALGGQPVTLGPRILRTETAGLAALAVVQAALGEM